MDGIFPLDKFRVLDADLLGSKDNEIGDIVGTVVEIGKEGEKKNKLSKYSTLKILSDGAIVTVSFWGETSEALQNELLVENEPVILSDVVKRSGFL